MVSFVEVQYCCVAAREVSRIVQHLEPEIEASMIQAASKTVDEGDSSRDPQVPVEPDKRKCLRCDVARIAQGHVVPRRSAQQFLGKVQGHRRAGFSRCISR